MRKVLMLAVPVVMAGAAQAGTLELSVEIPKLTVAEYHRPYLAIWIEARGCMGQEWSVSWACETADRSQRGRQREESGCAWMWTRL
jgi:hypothetical protein